MRISKSLGALVAGLFTMAAVVFGLQSPAMAASGTLYMPTGAGYGTYNVDTANDTLTLSATSGTLASGQCVTMWVDIKRNSGNPEGSHYDIRAARTCRSNTTMAVGIQYEGSTYGTNITGINKLVICRGANNTNNGCYATLGSISTVNPVAGNTCGRFWVRNANNTTSYYGGGAVNKCDS